MNNIVKLVFCIFLSYNIHDVSLLCILVLVD